MEGGCQVLPSGVVIWMQAARISAHLHPPMARLRNNFTTLPRCSAASGQ
jgi:hypothetical protein